MTTTRPLKSLSIAGLLIGLILPLSVAFGVQTAHAAALTFTDPSGDTSRPGLDLINATLDNGDYTVTIDINFKAHKSGTTVVGLRARERGTLRIANLHDADGRDRTLLLNSSGRIACDGLSAQWRDKRAALRLEVPSGCLWQGNYGAIRPWLLTEGLKSGSDVDYAATDTWTPRG
ncbi:MAG: hypothetical protein ACJ73J_09775 [Actinomycetes bacterium]